MEDHSQRMRYLRAWSVLLIAVLVFPLLLLTEDVSAKRGGDRDNRERFYGLVQSMPASGLQGEWVVGGRTVVADAATEFHEKAGPLRVGGCAKVDLRNGRTHEIESQPAHDCR